MNNSISDQIVIQPLSAKDQNITPKHLFLESKYSIYNCKNSYTDEKSFQKV